jgi:Protein tyrosine/serine phosphatase
MIKNLSGWLAAIFLLPSCSGNSPDISVVCKENNVGNHLIIWETTPAIDGKVKIYSSTDPNRISEKKPVATADISDQSVTIVTTDPSERFYYKLVFNNRYKKIVASENINVPGIQNFRDIGGIPVGKKQTKWGQLYRSGQIRSLSYSSHKELKNIGIKTIVDLRSESEIRDGSELTDQSFNIINIPIVTIKDRDIIRSLRVGKIRNDSIYRLMVRINQDLVTYFRKEYRQVFDILLKEDNYPVVISCNTGMGRASIASALVLSALGAPEDIVMRDYRLNNEYFDIPSASGYGYNLPYSSQEAITTLFSAREDFLNAAIRQIEKNYGDMDNYLRRGIGLTDDEIKHLKSILLN